MLKLKMISFLMDNISSITEFIYYSHLKWRFSPKASKCGMLPMHNALFCEVWTLC